eukprot:UC4_evm4s347
MTSNPPLIDIGPLVSTSRDVWHVTAQCGAACKSILAACRTYGFFMIKNHGVAIQLQDDLETAARRFFSLPQEEKMEISMAHGGKAWRGYFPVGDEVENSAALPPLHGANLFPRGEPRMRALVLNYMDVMSELGKILLSALAVGMGLKYYRFDEQFSPAPFYLFRIFNYPKHEGVKYPNSFAVGEHTDYGFLTILRQDTEGGLEVKSIDNKQWIDIPAENSDHFVVNLGDALEYLSGGLLRATPHRVRRRCRVEDGNSRLSFPFFFDPAFQSDMTSLADELSPSLKEAGRARLEAGEKRWDSEDLSRFKGKYGEYLLKKVSRVFPDLAKAAL